jgi:1,5-anhydro-D-fructose reductase (1,5-anhydro-D-mannitol-forming)
MIGWIVVGLGDIAERRVVPAILSHAGSQLVGVVTRNPAKAEKYQVPAWTPLSEALQESGCDAVYIATPVSLHCEQTIASLQAGKHVLCEKPVALNYAQAAEMVAAAEERGRSLAIAYYRRYYPKVLRAKALLAAGAIGTPVLGEATAHSWFEPDGDFRSWLFDPALAGGGPIFDVGSHRIDLLNYFLGEPAAAVGLKGNAVLKWDVEDNATVMIDYRSGARGIVDARWHSRVVRDEFRIRGTEGEIDLSPLNSPSLVSPAGAEQIAAPDNLHYPCIAGFAESLSGSDTCFSHGPAAILTDWVTEQAFRK